MSGALAWAGVDMAASVGGGRGRCDGSMKALRRRCEGAANGGGKDGARPWRRGRGWDGYTRDFR